MEVTGNPIFHWLIDIVNRNFTAGLELPLAQKGREEEGGAVAKRQATC